MKKLLVFAFTGLALSAATPSVVHASSPSIVVFYGGRLESPVVMTDAEDIALLVGEVAAARSTRRSKIVDRAYVGIALFWGDTNIPRKTRRGPLDGLRITDADQFGRVFLGVKTEPPAIDLPWYGQWPRELSLAAQQLLRVTAFRCHPRHLMVLPGNNDSDRSQLASVQRSRSPCSALRSLGSISDHDPSPRSEQTSTARFRQHPPGDLAYWPTPNAQRCGPSFRAGSGRHLVG